MALCGVLALTACDQPGEPEVEEPSPRPVKTLVLHDPDTIAERSFSGRVRAAERAWLAFRVGGELDEVAVEVGDSVERGALLARIDQRDFEREVAELEGRLAEARAELRMMRAGAREEEIRRLEARLEAAEARLAHARVDYQRAADLVEDGVIPRSEYDAAARELREAESHARSVREELAVARRGAREEEIEAGEARVASLQARLGHARDRLGYTELQAPFAGAIAERRVEAHEHVRPQEPVFLLESPERMEVEVGIPEELMVYRDRLREVRVRVPAAGDATFTAEVTSVGVDVLPERQTYPVKVAFDDPERVALPGMTAEVVFQADVAAGAGFRLPLSAVLERDGAHYVWVRAEDDGRVARREVEIFGLDRDAALIGEGLAVGEEVVVAGVHYLREGQRTRRMEPRTP